jgi:FixJ family two-component response regulator
MTPEQFIAIVDDDAGVRQSATNLFRSMGLKARAFTSAEEFLSCGAVDDVSCLVLDVQMPGMGGLDLQSHLAAIDRHIPIVFVTGYPDDGVRTKAMQSGAVCFLTKPVETGDLLDGLRSALTANDKE